MARRKKARTRPARLRQRRRRAKPKRARSRPVRRRPSAPRRGTRKPRGAPSRRASRRPGAKAEARPKGPDLKAIALKWQVACEKAHVYVARADPARPKWYSTVPYPYMNGFQHLGFGTSFLRAEFQSRYRRMLGYNVLHPQAFHCTGLPILGAAKRVAEKEPKQWDILRKMGIPDREIPKFADPMHWIEVFPAATMEDLKGLGAAVDWTRSFITTPLNPPYDAFVRWQFHHLKDGDFVKIDKHPVIWCPKDQAPIGDHDRIEGEGEVPMEYTLLKFPLADGRFLVAATIRPETVYGQTNLWADPKAHYVVAKVGEERWILNELAAKKLSEQGRTVIVERLGIRSQGDREKLEQAKAEVYKAGFYRGVLNENCGPYAGMRVEVAKDEIRKELMSKGQADSMWEPSGEVVCRCTTRAIVKVVDNQWFLAYGDPKWKAKAHEAIASMDHHPEALRKWLDYVIDWLRDWPCTHHRGLGTILPWDSNWVIESLSDSTIYPAYYTIAHALQGGDLRSKVPWASRLDDAFFDYVFFGKGAPRSIASRLGVEAKVIESLHQEFTYWYPIDLRNTGKDLVQNHMAFCLFNHTAIFPREHWPRGYGVNGWVRMAGKKMSKSRGNVWYIREALRDWPADVIRLTIANAGDGLDDPNVDLDFAETAQVRLADWMRFATAKHSTRRETHGIDAWFRSVLNRTVRATRAAMEDMSYKAALRHGYFDLQSAWSWYLRRSEDRPHADSLRRFIEVQTKILAPFAPHVAEEIWHRIGGKGLVVDAAYPEVNEKEIDPQAEAAEALLQSTLSDIREILKVTRLTPKRIALYVAAEWKARVHELARSLAAGGGLSMNVLMEKALAEPGMRALAKEAASYAKQVAEELRHARPEELDRFGSVDEFAMFRENAHFLTKELAAKVDVFRADDPRRWDPMKKADRAVPGRPAIYVE